MRVNHRTLHVDPEHIFIIHTDMLTKAVALKELIKNKVLPKADFPFYELILWRLSISYNEDFSTRLKEISLDCKDHGLRFDCGPNGAMWAPRFEGRDHGRIQRIGPIRRLGDYFTTADYDIRVEDDDLKVHILVQVPGGGELLVPSSRAKLFHFLLVKKHI